MARPFYLGDATCLARHLMRHPYRDREAVAWRVIQDAEAEGLSVMDKALRLGAEPEPPLSDPNYTHALLVVLHIADDLAWRNAEAAA